MIPPRGNHPVHGHFWIPIDDENCWAWSFDYHPTRALTEAEVQAMRDGKGIHVRYVPGTFIPEANRDNDYLMDRAGQQAGRDLSAAWRASPCRTPRCRRAWGRSSIARRENLVTTDNGIIMARRALLRAAQALAGAGRGAAGHRSGDASRALGRAGAAGGRSRSPRRRARR